MYNFRKLTGTYLLEAITSRDDGDASKYSAQISLSAKYRNEEKYYLFELTRSKVMLNDAPPTQIVDKFMLKLSDAYYPLKLEVSPEGEIFGVHNFEEIRKRWTKEVEYVRENTPCLAYERYIKMSKHNMANEKSFLQVLKRDSFIQFYFMPYADSINIKLNGFPTKDTEGFPIHLHRDGNATELLSDMYTYRWESDSIHSAELVCMLSDLADPVSIQSVFKSKIADTEYKKKINIKAENRDAKKSNKLVSFLID